MNTSTLCIFSEPHKQATPTHLLCDSMVESTVSHISIELAHCLREPDALRQVDKVLEILTLNLFIHWEVQWSQSLTTVCALHLDTDISITTGTHTIQNRA